MTQRRPTRRQIQRVNLGKTVLLTMLGGLILWLWLTPQQEGDQPVALLPTVAPTAVIEPVPTVALTQVAVEPAETTETAVATPFVNIPKEMDVGTIILSGVAELPGAPVEILVDGETQGEAVVNDESTWTLALELTTPGTYEIVTRIYEGGEDAETVFFEETLEVIVRPTVAPPVLNLTGNERLQEGEVTLSGQGEPDSFIEIVVNEVLIGTAEVPANGRWSFPFAAEEPGVYEIQLQMFDRRGALLASSEPSTLVIEPPLEAEIDVVGASFEELALVAGDTVTLTGQVISDATVELFLDDALLDTVTADEDGRWLWLFTLPESGEYELMLQVFDETGEMIASNFAPLVVEMPTTEVKETPTSTVEEPVVQTPVPSTPEPEPTPTSSGLVINPLQISFPAEGDVLDDVLIRLLGTGPARQQIELLDNGVVVGETTVPDSGIWRYSFRAESGTHALSVRLIGDSESETEPFEVTLNRPPINPACENPEPGEDLGDRYIVGDCEWLLQITNRLGVDYEEVLALNPDIEEPNELFPGQVIILPARN